MKSLIAKRIRIDPNTGKVTEEDLEKDDQGKESDEMIEREEEKRGVYRGFGQYL